MQHDVNFYTHKALKRIPHPVEKDSIISSVGAHYVRTSEGNTEKYEVIQSEEVQELLELQLAITLNDTDYKDRIIFNTGSSIIAERANQYFGDAQIRYWKWQ